MVKGGAEGLGFQALLRDLGIEAKVVVKGDSTAAKAMVSRSGIGRVRHLETRFLWVQEAIERRLFSVEKVAGVANPANALTKYVGAAEIRLVSSLVNFCIDL